MSGVGVDEVEVELELLRVEGEVDGGGRIVET